MDQSFDLWLTLLGSALVWFLTKPENEENPSDEAPPSSLTPGPFVLFTWVSQSYIPEPARALRQEAIREKELGDDAWQHGRRSVARKHHKHAGDLNAEACEIIFEEQYRKPNILDLHGLYVSEAKHKVEYAIFLAELHGYPELRLIVGKGRHSLDGQPRLGPQLKSFIEADQHRFVRIDEQNSGVLTVSMPSWAQWAIGIGALALLLEYAFGREDGDPPLNSPPTPAPKPATVAALIARRSTRTHGDARQPSPTLAQNSPPAPLRQTPSERQSISSSTEEGRQARLSRRSYSPNSWGRDSIPLAAVELRKKAGELKERANALRESWPGEHNSMEEQALRARALEADSEAAELIFRATNMGRPSNEIDLHGLKVKEAKGRVRNFLDESRNRGLNQLRVIVGRGLHSDNGARLKPEITAFIRDEAQLAVCVDGKNSGALIVSLHGRGG
uniref:Smr domain-containing protein n=1 Tax=Mycena chlorophos TaxID=658473 RepID=A0ABQ0M256_MYCCL|nr:predicted protein [Mycena chlorophos]